MGKTGRGPPLRARAASISASQVRGGWSRPEAHRVRGTHSWSPTHEGPFGEDGEGRSLRDRNSLLLQEEVTSDAREPGTQHRALRVIDVPPKCLNLALKWASLVVHSTTGGLLRSAGA